MEIIQDVLIQCDNKSCDYKVINDSKNPYIDTSEYVNMPCPNCGENLLTEKDYEDYKAILNAVSIMEELTKVIDIKEGNAKNISFHCHDGIITIKEE